VNVRTIAAVAAALVLLSGCGDTSAQEPESGSEQVTERQPVSPDGAMLPGPTELVFDVPSCMGDPVVDELEEDDEQVRIRIVTAMLVGGEGPACGDGLRVTLNAPLDGRTVIDLVSGETVTVAELDTEPGTGGVSPTDLFGRSFVSSGVRVDGEPLQLVGGPLAVRFDGHDGDRIDISWEAGCNIAGGKFDVTAERLEPRRSPDGVAAFDVTEMGCEPEQHEQDEWLHDVFADGVTWDLDGDTLRLSMDSVDMAFNEGPWRRG
jgi:hypothetical protein